MYISASVFLDENPELVGTVSFCVLMRYVSVLVGGFFAFFESKQMNKPHYKGVFIFLVLSVRDCSDFLSALPYV